MTEAAAPTSAPAAAPAAPPSAPSSPAPSPASPASPAPDDGEDFFSTTNNFHEFVEKVENRAKNRPKETPEPKSRQTLEQPKETAPPESTEEPIAPVDEPVVDPDAPPPDVAAQQAAELEQWGKFKEWMQMGGKPPAELEDVPVELPDGRIETWGEVMRGNMRQDDHTRGWQEMQAREKRADAAVNAYKQHFEQIENPDPVKGGEAMYEVYTRGKRRAAFMEAAKKLATDQQEDFTHAEGYAIAFARRERLLDQNGQPLWQHRDVDKAYNDALKERERIRTDRDIGREREWENERLRQQTQQTQQQTQAAEYGKNVEKQLEQLRPRAFKALGILHDAENSQIFRRKLAARAEQTGAQVLTPELVMEAARMTRDHLASERAQRQGTGTKPQQRQFTPQLGGGGGKIPKPESTEDMTDEQFAKKFGLRSW